MISPRKILSHSLTTILACALFSGTGFIHADALPAPATQASTTAQTASNKSSHRRASATPAASPSQIADAKAKGMVWANTQTRVYHTGGRYYGKTKHGQFMTLSDAQKAGYKAAKR